MVPVSLATGRDQDCGPDSAHLGAQPARVIHVRLDVLEGWSDSEDRAGSRPAAAGPESSGAQGATETVEVSLPLPA